MAVAQEGSFGARLRRLREAAGLTQEELALRAGLSPDAVGALERGQRKRPYPHTVRVLAEALGLSGGERGALIASAPRRSGMAFTEPAVREATPSTPPTPLVGRARELGELRASLAQREVRLLTLTGPGGVGKTRLALEAARGSADLFADGVVFVELASLGNAVLVLSAVAQALGLKTTGGRPLLEGLQAYLRERRLLLVLDNFEHLLGAAPEVAGLVSSCPNLTVLVSSRAPLRVRGERQYPVPPLGLTDPARTQDFKEVAGSPAARLFVERAREAAPSFRLTQANTAVVATICRQLEGLPLALELAAAKVALLGPAVLLSRLDRALEVGGARDLPERQQTMRATLRWSHDLLSGGEKSLFRRLGVFAGGFSLEAAEAVGAAGEVSAEGVLGLLGRLVEQSLVAAKNPGEEEPRYRMLEPVRQYAKEKLEESGEAEETRRRHAAFFLALAEYAEPRLRGPDQVEWLDRLDLENGNLRTAMDWALSAGETEIAARMGWALWLFWWHHGPYREGRLWMEAVLNRNPPPAIRAMASGTAGIMAYTQGHYPAAERYMHESLELAREVGNTILSAHALHGLGLLALEDQDLEVAKARFKEALDLYLSTDNTQQISLTQTHLGSVLLLQGERKRAVAMLEEGLAVARRTGDRASAYVALYNLALVALSGGDHDGAAPLFEEGVIYSEQMKDLANLAYCLEGLAAIAAARGETERCARLLGASEGLHEAVGAPVYVYYEPHRSIYGRTANAVRSQLGEEGFEKARTDGRTMSFEKAVVYALGKDEASPS